MPVNAYFGLGGLVANVVGEAVICGAGVVLGWVTTGGDFGGAGDVAAAANAASCFCCW